jgi:hypothetical protein
MPVTGDDSGLKPVSAQLCDRDDLQFRKAPVAGLGERDPLVILYKISKYQSDSTCIDGHFTLP